MANLKEKLGKRIQEIRKSQKITQEKLAEIINLDTPNLSNIERGKNFMTAETLEKISKALNIEEKELFNFGHFLSDELLKNELKKQIDLLNSKELQYLFKTIENIKQLRK